MNNNNKVSNFVVNRAKALGNHAADQTAKADLFETAKQLESIENRLARFYSITAEEESLLQRWSGLMYRS